MNTKTDYIKLETIEVPPLKENTRMSDFYRPNIFRTILSRAALKKSIDKGYVFLNGQRAYTSDYIRGGEKIDIYRPLEEKQKPSISFPLDVVYEDNVIAVINKPCGIVVSGNKSWTLENALPFNLKPTQEIDALIRPEPVHRLDYPTSGALLVAKTPSALLSLNKAFEKREIYKSYRAICIGPMQSLGKVDFKIDGKKALSEYKVLDRVPSAKYQYLNLCELIPHTGRTHQLRKHMAGLGHPVFGDLKYGKEGWLLKGHGLYLHSYSIEFTHTSTSKLMKIIVPMPEKFIRLFPDK